MNDKNKKIVTILSIFTIIFTLMGGTLAYWNWSSDIRTGVAFTIDKDFSCSADGGQDLTSTNIALQPTADCTNPDSALQRTIKVTPNIKKTGLTINLNMWLKVNNIDPELAASDNLMYAISTVEGSCKKGMDGYIYGGNFKDLTTGDKVDLVSGKSYTGTNLGQDTYYLYIWLDAAETNSNTMDKSFDLSLEGECTDNPEIPMFSMETMAYDILKNNGGVNAASLFSVTYVSEASSETYSSVSKTANNWYGTAYTFNEETGNYQLSGTLVQATLEECRNGTKSCGEYTLKSSIQDNVARTIYKITSFTNSTNSDTTSTLYMTAQSITSSNDLTKKEDGLFKTNDDLGISYFYRGNVNNNYVQFGKYSSDIKKIIGYGSEWYNEEEYKVFDTMEDCESSYDFNKNCSEVTVARAGDLMYWRIVRINGDGTIRLVYDGTEKVKNGTIHNASLWHTIYCDGSDCWGYGGSSIKSTLESWYGTSLKTNYGSYIADGIFCDDTEVVSETYYDSDGNEITEEEFVGDGYFEIYFAPYYRLGVQPQLTCTRKEDRYTVDDITNGNGLLTDPVGLLSADEVNFASKNCNTYLYSGENFWTLTVRDYGGEGFDSRIYVTDGCSFYYDTTPDCGGNACGIGARPVINLRADVEFTGDGSFEEPYVIKTN